MLLLLLLLLVLLPHLDNDIIWKQLPLADNLLHLQIHGCKNSSSSSSRRRQYKHVVEARQTLEAIRPAN
jgi:hypothetical protein